MLDSDEIWHERVDDIGLHTHEISCESNLPFLNGRRLTANSPSKTCRLIPFRANFLKSVAELAPTNGMLDSYEIWCTFVAYLGEESCQISTKSTQ